MSAARAAAVGAKPWLLGGLLVAAVALPDGRRAPLLAALGVLAVLVALLARRPYPRLAPPVRLAVIVLAFVIVALLRESAGGSGSGFAPLLIGVALWVALVGSRAETVFALGCLAATLVLPVVLVGPPLYGHSDIRRALISCLVAGIAALVLRRALARARAAERALARSRSFELHDDVVQLLAASLINLDLGRLAVARGEIRTALRSTQEMIATLRDDDSGPPLPGSYQRDLPPPP